MSQSLYPASLTRPWLKTDGTLWVTGSNASGQHGLGDTANRSVWTQTGFTQPAKVTGVNASDGTQYNKVTVSWTADPYANQYDLYRSTAIGTKGAAVMTNATGTSYDDITVSGLTHYPKNRSWNVRKPFVLNLSKHERLSHVHPFGEHSKTPLTLRQAQGERDFGMLNCGF